MIPKDLTKDITTRLKSISGQIDGVVRMLEEDKSPKDIILQVKAAETGLQKAHHLLLDEVYRKALALQIVQATEACPGNCGNQDKIEALRKEFPAINADELPQKMKEAADLHQWLEGYLKTHNKNDRKE